MRTTNYTDQDIIENSAYVKSLAGLLRSLGLNPRGANYANMKRKLQRLDVDTSHWTGQGWSADQRLKDWSEYTKHAHAKPHLIRERGHRCEQCLLSEWLEQPIPLELDHIDGDRTHNQPANWRLLCPNCHAQTPTWRNRKSKPTVGI